MPNSETFTRKTLIFSEIQPKGEEVKAKKRKMPDARMYARVGAVAEVGGRVPLEKSASPRCRSTPYVG